MDKHNRITIHKVVRELLGVGPGDIIEIDVVGKVKAKSESPLNALVVPAIA